MWPDAPTGQPPQRVGALGAAGSWGLPHCWCPDHRCPTRVRRDPLCGWRRPRGGSVRSGTPRCRERPNRADDRPPTFGERPDQRRARPSLAGGSAGPDVRGAHPVYDAGAVAPGVSAALDGRRPRGLGRRCARPAARHTSIRARRDPSGTERPRSIGRAAPPRCPRAVAREDRAGEPGGGSLDPSVVRLGAAEPRPPARGPTVVWSLRVHRSRVAAGARWPGVRRLEGAHTASDGRRRGPRGRPSRAGVVDRSSRSPRSGSVRHSRA